MHDLQVPTNSVHVGSGGLIHFPGRGHFRLLYYKKCVQYKIQFFS